MRLLLPRLLLIDTCGPEATLALAQGAEILGTETLIERSTSTMLLPRLRKLFAETKTTLQQVDAIAIVTGPGSFTGVRIGVAAAKGLAEGAGKPVIALSRLAVLAHLSGAEGVIHAVLDAGRGEFYLGTYTHSGDVHLCEHEAMETQEELLAAIAAAPGAISLCEVKVAAALASSSPVLRPQPTAADALPLAAAAFAKENFADVVTLDANYLRRTDAELLQKQKADMARRAGEL